MGNDVQGLSERHLVGRRRALEVPGQRVAESRGRDEDQSELNAGEKKSAGQSRHGRSLFVRGLALEISTDDFDVHPSPATISSNTRAVSVHRDVYLWRTRQYELTRGCATILTWPGRTRG